MELIANTDGCCVPNPGEGSCGFIIRDAGGRQLLARGHYLGLHCTCNVAEFTAVIRAADAAHELGAQRLEVRADSRLVVEVLLGKWKAKLPHIRELKSQALESLNRIPQWSISWVPREQNVVADTIANNSVTFRRDLDYSDKDILAPAERPQRTYYRKGHRQNEREAGWRRRETIRQKQLQMRNSKR